MFFLYIYIYTCVYIYMYIYFFVSNSWIAFLSVIKLLFDNRKKKKKPHISNEDNVKFCLFT